MTDRLRLISLLLVAASILSPSLQAAATRRRACAFSVANEDQELSFAKQCLEKICAPASAVLAAEKPLPENLRKQAEALMDRRISENHRRLEKRLTQLRKRAARGPLPLNDDERAALNLSLTLAVFHRLYHTTEGFAAQEVFTDTLPRAGMPKKLSILEFRPEQMKRMQAFAQIPAIESALATALNRQDLSTQTYWSELDPAKTPGENYKKVAQALRTRLTSLENDPFYRGIIGSEGLQFLRTPSAEDRARLQRISERVKLADAFESRPDWKRTLASSEIFPVQGKRIDLGHYDLGNPDLSKTGDLLPETKRFCASLQRIAYGQGLSVEDGMRAKVQAEAGRTTYLQNRSRDLSKASAEALSQKLNSYTVLAPKTPTQIQTEFLNRLAASPRPTPAAETDFDALIALTEDSLDPYGDMGLAESCNSVIETHPGFARVNSENKTIVFSADLIRSGNLESILTHEFSHVLYGEHEAGDISEHTAQRLIALETCLIRRHGSSLTPTLRLPTTEEDFADFFAARDRPEKNAGCVLANRNLDNEEYGYARAAGSNEPHSTVLFRAIQAELDRGKPLPPICQQIPGFKAALPLAKCAL